MDPQLRLPNGQWAAARAIIAAVDEAECRIQKNPETYALHASLLSDVNALLVQQARDALARAEGQLREALACASGRTDSKMAELAEKLRAPLIEDTPSHSAIISPGDAKGFGLPVLEADPTDCQWRAIWRLWAKYNVLNAARVYEGRRASVVGPRNPA